MKMIARRDLIDAFSLVLWNKCRKNAAPENPPEDDNPCHMFFHLETSFWNLKDFCRIAFRKMQCSKACVAVALVYLERLALKESLLKVCDKNCMWLAASALVLASKWLDEQNYSDAHYADSIGCTIEGMRKLTGHMLKCIEFRLFVNKKDYNKFIGLVLANLHRG